MAQIEEEISTITLILCSIQGSIAGVGLLVVGIGTEYPPFFLLGVLVFVISITVTIIIQFVT